VHRQRTYLTSGLVVMLRMSCIAQMPTATPVAAKSGYTCGQKPTIRQEDDEQQPGPKRSRWERNGGRNKGRGGGRGGAKPADRLLTSGRIHRLGQAPAEAMRSRSHAAARRRGTRRDGSADAASRCGANMPVAFWKEDEVSARPVSLSVAVAARVDRGVAVA
jgi:hypothetical protein